MVEYVRFNPSRTQCIKIIPKKRGLTLTAKTQELNGVQETFYRLKK